MKKKYKQRFFSLLVFLMIAIYSNSQDPQLMSLNSSSIYLNPSFAGHDTCARVVSLFQLQYPQIPGNYYTGYLSYDKKVKEIYGGVSFRGMYNSDLSGAIITKSSFLSYSSHLSFFNNKLSIFPAIEFGVYYKKLDLRRLFPDMLDPNYGRIYNINLSELKNPLTVFDINSGIIIAHHNFVYGTSIHHINKPEDNLYYTGSLPAKYTIHALYRYKLNERISIRPQFVYQIQDKYEYYIANMTFAYKRYITTLGYANFSRLKNRYNLRIGYRFNKFAITYSYLASLFKLNQQYSNSHEISAAFFFDWKDRDNNLVD